MSTPGLKPRKSASFKQESFEQEWQKLAESAQAVAAKQKTSRSQAGTPGCKWLEQPEKNPGPIGLEIGSI